MLKRCLPALALFLIAPVVGELLLGNLAFSQLPLFLPVLVPMYGGGALLIREVTRRAGRGPVTMLILGVAYGLVEEGLADQMLFNRHYAGHDEMGDTYVSALGMGGWLTVGVLTMHAVWSTNAGIALVEALFPERAETPWLGRTGLGITAAVFVLGTVVVTWGSYDEEHFFAEPAQLIATVVAIVALVVVAFRIRPRAALDGTAPKPWIVGLVGFVAASLFLNSADLPGWWSFVAAIALLAGTIIVMGRWCRQRGWGREHRLALAAAAILTYAWVGFGMTPETAAKTTGDYVVNVVLALGSVALLALAMRRLHALRAPVASNEERVPA